MKLIKLDNIASDIEKYLEIPSDKIDIIYNGIASIPVNSNSTIAFPLNNYIIYIGAYDKHKNLDIVIHAMKDMRLNNIDLVLVGNNKEYKPFR